MGAPGAVDRLCQCSQNPLLGRHVSVLILSQLVKTSLKSNVTCGSNLEILQSRWQSCTQIEV